MDVTSYHPLGVWSCRSRTFEDVTCTVQHVIDDRVAGCPIVLSGAPVTCSYEKPSYAEAVCCA